MPSWQPVRLARVVAASMVLARTFAPDDAAGTQLDLMNWLGAAAAPALQAAAPSNDPALAGREALKHALSAAYLQLQRVGPAWLEAVRVEVAFDPTFQPYYALSATQPLVRTLDRTLTIDLSGGFLYDPAGRNAGHLGLSYQGRLARRELQFGVQGSIEDNWLLDVQRYTVVSEVGFGPLRVRAGAFDEVHHDAASEQFERTLDGYELGIDARIPQLPWASIAARRFWQVAADGDSAALRDSLSLRLTPLTALEIEAGTESEAALRSWFARLRCRIDLGS